MLLSSLTGCTVGLSGCLGVLSGGKGDSTRSPSESPDTSTEPTDRPETPVATSTQTTTGPVKKTDEYTLEQATVPEVPVRLGIGVKKKTPEETDYAIWATPKDDADLNAFVMGDDAAVVGFDAQLFLGGEVVETLKRGGGSAFRDDLDDNGEDLRHSARVYLSGFAEYNYLQFNGSVFRSFTPEEWLEQGTYPPLAGFSVENDAGRVVITATFRPADDDKPSRQFGKVELGQARQPTPTANPRPTVTPENGLVIGVQPRANAGYDLFFASTDGPLPAGTEITIDAAVNDEEKTVTLTSDEQVPEGQRLYLDVEGRDSVLATQQPDRGRLYPSQSDLTITVTVDTGQRQTTQTFSDDDGEFRRRD